MPTDIILDDGGEETIRIKGSAVTMESADLLLDHPDRRLNNRGVRRALVHDQRDGLTINYNGDYPGGVTIVGLNLPDKNPGMIKVLSQNGRAPRLPMKASRGELVVVVNRDPIFVGEAAVSLWICVGFTRRIVGGGGSLAIWNDIPFGPDVVEGTL
jgi:hypothetical protein